MTVQPTITGFQIHEEIARGGMAIVYRATQSALNRSVAIKIVRPDIVQRNPEFISRFDHEAKAIARLTHPYILPIYDYGSTDAFTYIVMQYIPDGTTLRDYRPALQEASSWQRTVEIGCQIADALVHAHHHRIIHCDLKPSNILWHEERPLLADFGLARLEYDGQEQSQEETMGTPAYMAPEQFRGQPLDGRTDIYSLGLVLYQLLTGILPHIADSVEQIASNRNTLPPPPSLHHPDVPTALDNVLLQALAVEPANRFATMADFLQGLQEILTTIPPTSRIPSRIGSTSRTTPLPSLHSETQDSALYDANHDTFISSPFAAPLQAPSEVPYFVERADLSEQIHQMLVSPHASPVVGLCGLGGSGKTALAVALAHTIKDHFPDGVLWAQLNVTNPSEALLGFASAFGQETLVAEAPDVVTKATIVRQILANKRLLVTLDNVDESEQVKHLIPTGEQNRTLITTRNRKLLANLGHTVINIPSFNQSEGLTLLEKVIGAERVDAEKDVAEQALDLVGHLPLAISIVAGYLAEAEDLTLAEYVADLQDEQSRLEALSDWEDSSKDVVASFELSYGRLPQPLQKLFAALAVFDGPDFSAEAVSQIVDLPLTRAKSGLGRLRSLSLVIGYEPDKESINKIIPKIEEPDNNQKPSEDPPSKPLPEIRYGLHPLLKLYAQSKAQDELGALQPKAASYFAALAEEHGVDGYEVLDREWPNIQGAMTWAYENELWETFIQGIQGLTVPHLGVVGFLDMRGLWNEARDLLALGISTTTTYLNDPILLAELNTKLGTFSVRLANYLYAQECLQLATTILDDLPVSVDTLRLRVYVYDSMAKIIAQEDRYTALEWLTQRLEEITDWDESALAVEKGQLHIQLASYFGRSGQLQDARDAAIEGLALVPPEPNPIRCQGLIILSNVAGQMGDSELCLEYIEQGIAIAQMLGDFRSLAYLWHNKGVEQTQSGQYKAAVRSYRKSLRIVQLMGDAMEGSLHSNLGLIYILLGKEKDASDHLHTALQFAKKNCIDDLAVYAKTNLTRLQLSLGQLELASVTISQAYETCLQRQLVGELPEILRLQAELELKADNVSTAVNLIDESIQAAQNVQYVLAEGISQRVKGNILSTIGQQDNALAAFLKSLEQIGEQDPFELARTKMDLASHYLKQPSQELATIKKLFDEALDTFERLDASREIRQVEELLSDELFNEILEGSN